MSPAAPTELLIEAAKDGDAGAWNTLARTWLPQVVNWARRLGGPRVDPHDISQEVFIVVTKRIDRLYSPEKWSGWLYGITRNVVISHRRRAWFRRVIPGLDREPVSKGRGADVIAEMSERAQRVHEALDRIPDKQREVVVLCLLEGRSTAEAAEMIGVAQGTVKSRMKVAKEKLARLLRTVEVE
jgi:RNA polymerase sigma-70 factor, ECF subfamily